MIKTVALLGADGNLGPSVYKALLAHNFDVTVLKRASSRSKSKYPRTITIPDVFPHDELVSALQGKDAVVVTIRGNDPTLQKKLADASVQAGVKRFIPADFGSCDSASPLTQETVALYRSKTELREYLIDLAGKNAAFSWTSLVSGHFFDWGLEFLHIWLRERKAEKLDDGNTKWSLSTLGRIGEATARVLLHPDVARNKMVYIQSFLVTQNEVIAAFERATGSTFEVKTYDSTAYLKAEKEKADAGDKVAIENLVWLLGTIDANWELRGDAFVMKALGLSNEDLQAVVDRIVQAAA